MKNKKEKTQCTVSSAPTNIECSNLNPNKIGRVKMSHDGDCYDEFDNYLGKGEIINGVLTIKRS